MEHLNPSALYGENMVEYGDAGVPAGSMMALITGQHQSAPESESCTFSECLNLSHAANMTFHEPQNIAHLVMEHLISRDQTVGVPADSSVVKTRVNGCGHPSHFELLRTKEEPVPFVVNPPPLVREARMEVDGQNTCCGTKSIEAEALMKAKMVAHPHYPRLVAAYIECQKVGAPPEVVAQLDGISQECQGRQHIATMSLGIDPELDQFMEAYCEMFTRYREELTKPFKEATMFLKKIETQLHNLTKSTVRVSPSEGEGLGSSEEDGSCGEVDFHEVDPHAEDRELKDKLLRKYGGYFGTLKQEFLKKKKKGKLPKEARQKLLDWWNLNNKWPYPSEHQKIALAESTGLDQKQINNWFINQRKRHWKPSEEMQFVVMESLNPRTAALYMDGNLNTDGSAFPMHC